MTNLQRIRNGLTPERRARIALRAKQIVAEELSLQELRRAHKLTQEQLAQSLGITQDQVSKLEKRVDILVSTLRKYVKAAGGELVLVATFPGQDPIRLAGFSQFPLASTERTENASRTASTKDRTRLKVIHGRSGSGLSLPKKWPQYPRSCTPSFRSLHAGEDVRFSVKKGRLSYTFKQRKLLQPTRSRFQTRNRAASDIFCLRCAALRNHPQLRRNPIDPPR